MGRDNDQKSATPREPDEDTPEVKDPPNDLPDYSDPPQPQPEVPTPPPVKARDFDPNDLSNYARESAEMLYHIPEPGTAHLFHMRDPIPSIVAYR